MSSTVAEVGTPACVWHLEGIGDDANVRRHAIATFPCRVGRDHRAALWLPHQSISKWHAEFSGEDGRLTLRDLGSTNGTFVNAERLSGDAALQAGDVVHFAHIGFRVGMWMCDDAHDTAVVEPLQSALLLEIEERRRAEEALWNSQAMWRALVDAVLDGVILIDMGGRIQCFNRAAERIFGYSAGELQGRNVGLLMPPDGCQSDKEGVIHGLVAGIARFAGEARQTTARRKDGSSFDVHLSISEVWLADRRMLAAVVRDVSEERLAAESLRLAMKAAEQASYAKSEFLANMSHEIRTPMSAILGYADLLVAEEGVDQAPPHRVEAFRTIKRNGEHLLQVINDILDLSKIEAGKLQLERMRCSLPDLIADVQRIVKQRALAKQLPLNFTLADDLPVTIETDPTRLRQVLINLIGNAIKFTDQGMVSVDVRLIEAEGGGARMEFAVSDTGIGMTAEQLDRLFQPFSQADASTSRRFGGTGLGLTISKRIVDQLGGEVLVESQYGRGSTFRAIVPIGAADPTPRVDQRAATPSGQRETLPTNQSLEALDCRILLAEDGLDNQRLLTFVLGKAGAHVTLAENGEAAVKLVLESMHSAREQGDVKPFDVILMDMQMPVLDGYQATRRLRAEGCATPIIALTAHAMQGDREHCLAAGCDDYLTKPIDRHVLCAAIRRHVSARSAAESVR
jgi:PAS domain S-box-containing protein